MAELNTKTTIDSKRKIRVRKQAPGVDLTAMVDLAFLLITFFMLTTSLNKPHQVDIAMPDQTQGNKTEMDENRIVSLLIGEGSVFWYHGDFQHPLIAPKNIDLNTSELRQTLLEMKKQVSTLTKGKDMIVLIKPSTHARTADLIQTLDEMKITAIERYMISKISPPEEQFLGFTAP
ncbi:ExbD/TolR family protein [Sphingobacterium yanglingense]|uniref:Biopolymer transport protein ExbD n=1 Tax=Sphingobacterium yanglingense TaxID=1437280 RepID=A0A4R6W5S0_9SPHI|nr:biopolymer transporter ExbD [Sphingobacterium yanglingense]TDQ72292.1 biopolymer transport protein ExbD [Sphingobacterium yanglingense]